MTPEQTLAFVAFAVVLAGTPGPSNAILTATGAAVGIVRGLWALLGVAVGMAVLIFVVAFGFGVLILDSPAVLTALRLLGAAVLLWLAWRLASAPTTSHGGSTGAPRPVGFFGAAAFQVINPKSWLASTGAAAFLGPGQAPGGTPVHAAVLAIVFGLTALPCCFVWLAFGAVVQRALRTERAQRSFNLVMAALLVASAAVVFLT